MLSDQELFMGLKNGDMKIIKAIYQSMLPRVTAMILKNRGDHDDAQDIFQETLEIILIKIEKVDSSFAGLLMRIAKNRWIDKLRKRKKMEIVSLNDDSNQAADIQATDLNKEYDKFQLMEKTFSQLGELCQNLLTLIKAGKSTGDIVAQLEFNSPNTMYRRKTACIQKWSELVKQNSTYKTFMA